MLDDSTDPVRALSVGYGSQVFDLIQGFSNFDPCTCLFTPGTLAPTWDELDPPDQVTGTANGPGKPLFRAIAKISSTAAVAAGGFGRIVHIDLNAGGVGEVAITDQGSVYPTRPNDGAFFSLGGVTRGVTAGQSLEITYSDNGGEDWSIAGKDWSLHDSHHIRGIAIDSSGNGIAVGDMLDDTFPEGFKGKGFIAVTDGVAPAQPYESWHLVQAPTGIRDLHDVTFADANTAFAVGENALVTKSTDGGATWNAPVSLPGTDVTLYGVSFADSSTGYVVGEQAIVFQTEDGGSTWTQGSIGATGETIRDVVTWGDGTEAIAVGDDGRVWTYAGFRFAPVYWPGASLTVDDDLYDVEVISNGSTATDVWVSGDGGVLLHRDGNGSWTKPESRTTIIIPKVSFLTAGEGYAVGGTFTILRYE